MGMMNGVMNNYKNYIEILDLFKYRRSYCTKVGVVVEGNDESPTTSIYITIRQLAESKLVFVCYWCTVHYLV